MTTHRRNKATMPGAHLQPPRFATVEEYAAKRADVPTWLPCIEAIFRRHGWAKPRHEPVATVGASNPTFFVGSRFVKIFCPYSNGKKQRGLEVVSLQALAGVPGLPVPRLLAEGELFPDRPWPYPYAVMQSVRGDSLYGTWPGLGSEDRIRLARQLGRAVRRMHDTPVPARLDTAFRAHWQGRGFSAFLGDQLRRSFRTNTACLTPRLRSQALDLLDAVLVESARPSVILHGDLTNDNLIVRRTSKVWRLAAIVDFGDVKIGDPVYDLPALLATWSADRSLLQAFLRAYRWSDWTDFRNRAMAYTLLHEWDVLPWMLQERPELKGLRDLKDLAEALYGVEPT